MRGFEPTQAIEHAAFEVFQKRHAAQALNQRTEDVRTRGIVIEQRARGLDWLVRKIERGAIHNARLEPIYAGKASGHHQHMPHGLLLQKGRHAFGQFIRKKTDDGIVERQFSLLAEKANGNGDKRFGDGIHPVRRLRGEGRPVFFKENFLAAHHEHAVHAHFFLLQHLHELREGLHGKGHTLRCGMLDHGRTAS